MKSRHLPLGSVVLVSWTDAWFEYEHATEEPFRDVYKVDTVGTVVHVGDAFLVLAQEVLPNDDGFRALTYIPHRGVEETTILK